jgi:hypothetical protein
MYVLFPSKYVSGRHEGEDEEVSRRFSQRKTADFNAGKRPALHATATITLLAEASESKASNQQQQPAMSNKKIYIETYGCQMNVADSEVVVSILSDHGFTHTGDIKEAELYPV